MNMDKWRHCTNARMLLRINTLYDSSTMLNELEPLHWHLDVLNEQRSSYIYQWMWLKKLIQVNKQIYGGDWHYDLKKDYIICFQETK